MSCVFLEKFNELFDCGNGSYCTQWIRVNKPNFKPYRNDGDERFKIYEDMIVYLEEWKKGSRGYTKPQSRREDSQTSIEANHGCLGDDLPRPACSN